MHHKIIISVSLVVTIVTLVSGIQSGPVGYENTQRTQPAHGQSRFLLSHLINSVNQNNNYNHKQGGYYPIYQPVHVQPVHVQPVHVQPVHVPVQHVAVPVKPIHAESIPIEYYHPVKPISIPIQYHQPQYHQPQYHQPQYHNYPQYLNYFGNPHISGQYRK